jgi:4-amino-4-deoxy-L-arabinose transferase-like glycosyltransferase
LLAVLALALLLRVAFIFYLEPGRIYFRDTVKYSAAAESLLAGNGFGDTYARQPLYPVFLAAILALFPGALIAAQLADAVLGVLVVFLTYHLGRRIWNARVGLSAAGLVAVHPYLVVLSAFLYAELLFIALLLTSLWLILHVSDGKRAFLAGVVGGGAVLAKASGIALLIAGLLWLACFGPARRSRRAAWAVMFAAGGFLALAPWVVRNYLHFHDLSLLESRKEIHLAYTPESSFPFHLNVEHRRAVSNGADAGLKQHGRRSLSVGHVVKQLGRFWALWPERLATAKREVREKAAQKDARVVVENHPAEKTSRFHLLLAVLLVPFYGLALVGLWRSRERPRESSLLLFVILAFTFGRALFMAKLRYRLPIEPAVALYAAAGLSWLAGHLTAARDPGQGADVSVPTEAALVPLDQP